MIQVTIFRTNDQITGYSCSGHADYADEGYDIICSAVSVLTLNTANALEALTADDVVIEQAEDGGYLKVMLTGKISEKADVLLQSLLLGLNMIEETYGSRYLHITQTDI